MTRLATTSAVLLLLAGCTLVQSPDDDERERLTRAEARWLARGLDDYEFVMARLCFCPYGGMPVRVTVRNGERVAAILVETGQAVPDQIAHGYHTVPEQFEFLREALRRTPHEFRADYHEGLGYPSHAWVDYEANIADEEQGFDVSGLTPLLD